MKLRKTTSLTTLLSFILLLITSIIMYITPQGKIAFWANWEIAGLGKEQWGALHTNLGILFVAAGLVHTVLNWKPIMTYLKTRTKKLRIFTTDFCIALGITLFITLFTLFELPPLSSVQAFNDKLKEAAAEEYGHPPYGHAEASSLKTFCKRTGINLEDALKGMSAANLKPASADATLGEIAAANDITPQQLYNTFKAAPDAGGGRTVPQQSGMGIGRKTLSDLCVENGLDAQATVEHLDGLGIKAAAGSTIREIAEANETEPIRIFEAIQEQSSK